MEKRVSEEWIRDRLLRARGAGWSGRHQPITNEDAILCLYELKDARRIIEERDKRIEALEWRLDQLPNMKCTDAALEKAADIMVDEYKKQEAENINFETKYNALRDAVRDAEVDDEIYGEPVLVEWEDWQKITKYIKTG